MKRIIILIFLLILITKNLYGFNIKFEIKTPDRTYNGSTVAVSLNASSDSPLIITNLEFRCKYEPDSMKIIKKSLGNRLFSFKGSERDDEFIIVMKRKQKLFLNSFSQNEIFSFNFRLKKYNTKENLKMTPDLIRLTTEESGENLTFEMPDQNISVIFDDCLLKSLLPSVGKLSPEFSPQTEDYIIHVPYSTKFIDFKTECSNDKKVKINRRKLNKAGSETEINVKVLGENSKKIYKIKIEREAKPKNFSKDFDKSPKPANEETPTEQHDQHGQHSEVNLSEGLILPAEAPELILKNNLFHEHLQDFFTVSSAIFIIFLIISRIKSKKRR